MRPGAENDEGRAELDRVLGEFLSAVTIEEIGFTTEELDVYRDKAYELGIFLQRYAYEDTVVTQRSRYISVWKRGEGLRSIEHVAHKLYLGGGVRREPCRRAHGTTATHQDVAGLGTERGRVLADRRLGLRTASYCCSEWRRPEAKFDRSDARAADSGASERQFGPLAREVTEDNRAINLSWGLGWGLFETEFGRRFFTRASMTAGRTTPSRTWTGGAGLSS